MSKKHSKYFSLAKTLSKKSNHPQYQMGCVIVKKNNVVSTGFNQLKTHPKSPHAWNMIHAEFAAILGVSASDLEGSTVYVYRELKNHEPAMAKPCKTCHKMLFNLGVKEVYFTTPTGAGHYLFKESYNEYEYIKM
jgi:deoxycytidylate deaminase